MTAPATLDGARALLRERLGFSGFRPGQERAIESVLAGRDTLVVLPTGGGKSLCYQVPALLLPRLTVVVSPLISLMKDQVDALTARNLPAAFLNSTLTPNEIADRLARAERGELKLLYVAPERFDMGRTLERIAGIGVSLLAVDEAHCISEWGHDFRPSYLRVRQVRERLGLPPTIALTATATPEVRRDIIKQLGLAQPEIIVTGFDRANLSYHVVRTRTEADKDGALVRTLKRFPGQAIVYAATRRAVERIAGVLDRAKIPALAYHAGLDDDHRHAVQDAFMNEEVRAIVATNAFGMGIDKANVRLVVHHAMPGSLEAYYQEAGRAGRDGEPSACVLLHAFRDRFTHEFFIKSGYPERAVVERVYAELRRAADDGGLAALTPESVSARSHGKVKEREAESALRILATAGAVSVEQGSVQRLRVRLLAAPERIRAELGPGHEQELELLRALWRAVGARLESGAVIDPDGLPPGFGGAIGVPPLLDALQSRQFLTWERTGTGLRLADRNAAIDRFRIDWDAIARRRKAETAKLDAVQRYAYTEKCRRGFLLRYFGDPAASDRCEGCDICLGTHVKEAESDSNRPFQHESAPRKRSAEHRAPSRPDSEVDVTAADPAVVGALRTLRGKLAKEEKVPAYVIFPDRTLAELAVRRPRTLDDLGAVHGVGPARLEKYGERLLEVLAGDAGTEAPPP
ncbi:MAG TPA: ATP-dependent DNA helicase RecQ [Gemmatimonadaceae bacterium]|nr:ATP-dependent DNA helicase RecQ [Gemmatimonadaceae bacterium]